MNRSTAAAALAACMIIVSAAPAQAHAATCRVVAMKPVVVATGVIEGSAVTRCDPGIFAPGHAWSQTTEAAVQVRAGLTNTRCRLPVRSELERVDQSSMDRCACSAGHRPRVLEYHDHHLWPIYLGGPAHPSTLVTLCPTTHSSIHRLLRAMVKAGAWIERSQGQPRYAHQLATLGFQAWDAAGRPT